MKLAHNIKVVDNDPLAPKFECPMCSYRKPNMAYFKNHMIAVHKKDEWNWGLDVREVHFCDECSIEFPEKVMLRKHIQSGHKEVSNIIVEDTIQKIEPDHEFLTQNTRDLEEMLKAIPVDTLNTCEDDFQKDFNEILNEKIDEPTKASEHDRKCQQCNFKASSRKVLRAHFAFVHDFSFYSCGVCSSRTKTMGALKQHMWNTHKTIPMLSPASDEMSKVDSTEDEDALTESENDELPELYQEHDWIGGRTFNARTPAFAKAVANIKVMLRKSAQVKKVEDIDLKVLNVVDRADGGGSLSQIEITDAEGTGHAQFQIFGPNKKTKKVTIQISKSSKGELRHAKVLAEKVVKPLLDKLLNGATIRNLMKSFFQVGEIKQEVTSEPYGCPICPRSFKAERAMKSHNTKMHKKKLGSNKNKTKKPCSDTESTEPESDKTLFKCEKCTFKNANEDKLKKHKKS